MRKVKALVHNLETEKFSVFKKVLSKDEKVLGTIIHKLAIPSNFAEQIIFNNHYTESRHMAAQSHAESFSANFYGKGCLEIAKKVVKSFVIFQLNSNNYNKKTSGSSRSESLNRSPGEIVYLDSIYLNCNLTAVPVKALKVANIFEAIKIHLSIMPFPKIFKSDMGPEYIMKFSAELAKYGFLHHGLLPNRSNQQGNVEIGVKLLRTMLSKLVALDKFSGRDEWTTSLPVVVKNINDLCAYGSPLSRSVTWH